MAETPPPRLPVKPLPPEAAEANAMSREDRIVKRIFLSPTVLILLGLSIFPLLWSLGVSFTDIQRSVTTGRAAQGQEAETPEDDGFLGLGFNLTLRNYDRLTRDDQLLNAARNTLFYVVGGVLIQYAIGFGLALLLNQEFAGRWFFRIVFILPMMITTVAAAYGGRMMFDSLLAPLAQFLRTVAGVLSNVTGQEIRIVAPWLTDTTWAPYTVLLVDSWQWIPFMTLVLLAALQAIPDEIYEAARVDGAAAWSIFWRITFPIMLPISMTVMLIRGLEIFKIVDIIRVMTGGGPGRSTESLVMYVYNIALTFGDYSYAAAVSYVLLVMVVLFSTLFLFLSRRIVHRQTGL